MHVFAQLLGADSGNPIMAPWELHPALVHFPIAFLLGGVVLDLYAWAAGRPDLARIATGLLIAGVLVGLVTGAAGVLALYTMPDTHTEQAHDLMYWHLGLQLGAVVLFAVSAWLRWRSGAGVGARLLGWVAAAVLVVGSWLGGYIVYHGAAGIDPELTNHELRHGHHHEH
jgi:uncharacterized membrane protein